jgi:hypothetical protein
MVGKDLIVLQEYDPLKSTEEYEFRSVPIWVRVFKLPLGTRNRATGEKIGVEIGEFLDVDVGEDDWAVGKYLRIRIIMDITKPVMRGITLQLGEKMLPKWFPIEYEFLPDFC